MPALAVLLLRRASLARERARAVKARGRAGRGASRARREQGAARAAHLFDVNEQHLPVTDRDGQDVLDAVEGQLLAHLHHRVPRRPVLRTTVQRPSAERVRARARTRARGGGEGRQRVRARARAPPDPREPRTPTHSSTHAAGVPRARGQLACRAPRARVGGPQGLQATASEAPHARRERPPMRDCRTAHSTLAVQPISLCAPWLCAPSR